MAGPSWLVDSKRIATKIKSASSTREGEVKWKSNPTRACPSCKHVIDNSDVVQEWPGLPRGVKFDPSDQEIIWHLLAKSGVGDSNPHPFINEFIPTVNEDDGICYVHPRKLPGVKQDGSVAHFFHRAIKAYNTGTRKRRKIQDGDSDVRWHKTGRTKPVNLDGVQKGCKKIMVLYMSAAKGGKTEKTNWVMHQYHLGTEEDEKDGEYVISKIFYQQNQVKQGDKTDLDTSEVADSVTTKACPVTPKSVTPDPPRGDRRLADLDLVPAVDKTEVCADPCLQFDAIEYLEDDIVVESENPFHGNQPNVENQEIGTDNRTFIEEELRTDENILVEEELEVNENILVEEELDTNENNVNCNPEDPKWWDSESQHLLNSQQLAEGLALCDDLLQSQSPIRDDNDDQPRKVRPKLADYAQLGPELLKKDLEACQSLDLDQPPNSDLDAPLSEFRLSQIEFGSQESFLAWGGKISD